MLDPLHPSPFFNTYCPLCLKVLNIGKYLFHIDQIKSMPRKESVNIVRAAAPFVRTLGNGFTHS